MFVRVSEILSYAFVPNENVNKTKRNNNKSYSTVYKYLHRVINFEGVHYIPILIHHCGAISSCAQASKSKSGCPVCLLFVAQKGFPFS